MSSQFKAYMQNTDDFFKEAAKVVNKTDKKSARPLSPVEQRAIKSNGDQKAITTLSNGDQKAITTLSNGDQKAITTLSNGDQKAIEKGDQKAIKSNGDQKAITTLSQPYQTAIIQEPVHLSDSHLIMYDYLLKKGLKGVWNAPEVSQATNLSIPTIRRANKEFKKNNIIQSKYNDKSKIFSYTITPEVIIFRKKAIKSEGNQTHITTLSEGDQTHITSTSLISKSVSSFNKNLLTEKILTDPDLEYWNSQDLPVKKIESWMTEFSFTEEQILNQLRYSAFEWKDKNSKEVQKPIGKFYTALKAGGFAKPTGYKTPEKKRQEILDAELKEKEQLLKDIKAKQEKIRQLDFEIWLAELPPETRKEIITKSKLPVKQKTKGTGPAVDAVLKKHYDANISINSEFSG